MEKWQFFYQEHGITLWKNVNFLTFWTFRFYNLERCLLVLEYRKTHFPGLQCLKKKVRKMAIFGPKAWVNPLEKCEFFDFLNLFFYSLERCYLVLEYRKRHFPGLYCLKKKLEKWPFLDQKRGLTFLKNVNFLTFWTLSFYSLERCFLVLEYRKRLFPGLYCLKKKSWKNGHFWTKSMG